MSSVPDQSSFSTGIFGALKAWFRRSLSVGSPESDYEPRGFGAANSPTHSALQVLVADDNPVNLMTISALLEQRGIIALLAVDGAEAVELACARTFDIVFMDVQMPVLDGLAATSRIRRFENMQSRRHVPVVAYSSTNVGLGLLKASGVNDVLAKPCTADEFDACMARWCPDFVSRAFTAMPARQTRQLPERTSAEWSSRNADQ